MTDLARETADLDGRYIHRRDPEKRPTGTRTMTVTVDGVEQEWVHADDFMDVQKERDDYRRCLALVNAWRWSPAFMQRQFAMLDQQLANAGLTMGDGRAMLSVIASVRAEADPSSYLRAKSLTTEREDGAA